MKRFAVLALTASLLPLGASLAAADSVPVYPSAAQAPTFPQVPQPVVADGTIVPPTDGTRTRLRDRIGNNIRLSGLTPFTASETKHASASPTPWCTNCAPAAPYPLPPLPTNANGMAAYPYGPQPLRSDDRGHWKRFTDWLCFRQTPNHLGLTPTPRITPQFTYFACQERGIGGGNCGAGGCGGGSGHLAGGGCKTCPQAGETLMTGYRLANPEAPAVAPVSGTTSFYRPVTNWKPSPQK